MQVPAFIPVYQSALVVCDLLTAILLWGQYGILRSRALLVLAAGYLFSALMAVAHALSFPGLFAAGGLFGAGRQTTAWLYFLWHGGFPLFVIGYALLKGGTRDGSTAPTDPRIEILISAFVALACAGGLTVLTTVGHSTLPPIMAGNADASTKVYVAAATWLFGLGALFIVWRRRPHSVLDLWLMVVLCVWTADSALAAVFNGARYDLGWYAGRIYGLLASGFVLVLLLLENGALHAQLAEAHDALAEKNAQLAQASRLKSEFLANMSHELRTPLNAVIGFSEVLKDGLAGELVAEQRNYVTDIYTSGQHLLSLINDILDLSKIEAGQMMLDLESTAAATLFEHSLSIVREKAAKRRLHLSIDVPRELGSLLLDPRKTKQILYNLLSNAVKFTQEGGSVTLRARRVARADVESWSDGASTVLRMPMATVQFESYLQIVVEDTGIGIAPEDASRLFRMFSQLDSSLTKEVEGTGLGLVLVEHLARLHGGGVAIASTPAEGSRLFVWLPWRDAGAAAEQLAGPAARGAVPAGRPLALVIEDNDHAAELIRVQLEPAGFKIVRAATARKALEWLVTGQPTVVVLDLLLPDMDGWDLLGLLKQPNSATAHIPVVIVSIVADMHKGFSLGASDVLQKPVSREELLDALANVGVNGMGRPVTRVLVVDDDPKAVSLLAAYLRGPRYSVLMAHGGKEGIEMAQRERPDLIVLDLMMPEVSGFDVVEVLKDNHETATIPIVVVTAKTLTAQDKATLNGLVAVVLGKATFNHGRFVNEVRRALAAERPEVLT
ncbi:response regulator [Caenimonas soli]|uniref:response regulator n=1 Tax=Caenimonas soli TaxID=2735555 RepID=UPI001F24F935|nr:response regulator [Caenimonas soli]